MPPHILRSVLTAAGAIACACASAFANETLPVNDIQDERAGRYALTNASIYITPDEKVERATLLISNGRIVSVNSAGSVPAGFVVIDASNRIIYPAFVELQSDYGLPETKPPAVSSFFSQPEVLTPQQPGAYSSNDAVRAHYRAAAELTVDNKAAQKLRQRGFGLALSSRGDGIARGTSALVSLADADIREVILRTDAARHFSLIKGTSRQAYPISKMGAVAVLRQSFLDARWYSAQNPRPFTDQSLAAILATDTLPAIAQAQDWRDALRLAAIGAEFNVDFALQTAGDSYQRVEPIKAAGMPLIVPINFPKAKKLESEFAAQNVELAELLHWELAPTNPATLEAEGIRFALTSNNSKDEFLANLRLAVEHGLSTTAALRALTTTPAAIIGMSEQAGSLKPGMRADFFVTQGDLFNPDARILDSWIGGQRHHIASYAADLSGTYQLAAEGREPRTFAIAGKPAKPKLKLNDAPDGAAKSAISVDGQQIELRMPDFDKPEAQISLAGWRSDASGIDAVWSGTATDAAGARFGWTMTRIEAGSEGGGDDQPEEPGDDEVEAANLNQLAQVPVPFEAYGKPQKTVASDVVIRNATIWTNEAEGILENADLVIRAGRIAAVGQNLNAPDLPSIDATGKHVTAGIIDEHSHIALSGVNDIATNSSMVRMRDVVDSEDVDIYRNLAGGVTAAQLLHGSANPIGGQSAIIKMRWGALPNEMLVKDAPGFIKFALGENVKRSSNAASIRYPQTRMGVEQVFVDAFTRARAYGDQHAAYKRLSRRQQSRTSPPRRDLALEPLLEILNADRFISAHSYVQSEINMLMHVADQFDFTVNTFTHILEGYKVADKMAAHGAGGSTFSDWWAYKWEVRYAIPYNANLMTQAGVVTAINSDSAEMSRRLNQEAAKSVKYGGMAEEEALKLVTLNPAILLHLDHRMGSLKAGKDADVVIWTDHPLSIYARAETTFVDGVPLFDLARNGDLNAEIKAERARLIGRMRQSKRVEKSGDAPGSGSPPGTLQCDSLEQHYADVSALMGEQP